MAFNRAGVYLKIPELAQNFSLKSGVFSCYYRGEGGCHFLSENY